MNKLLVIITGEAFRSGGYKSRTRDNPESYLEQIRASKSQMNFIDFIKQKLDLAVTISLNCYKTEYISDLLEIYSPDANHSEKYPDAIKQKHQSYKAIIDTDNANQFDIILLLRVDLLIKDYLCKHFELWDKIMFPFKDVGDCNGYPRVCCTMMYIPKRFIDMVIKKKIHDIVMHTSYYWCVEAGLNPKTDIGFFVDVIKDSNTQFMMNPVYTIVNRPEAKSIT